MLKFEGAIRAEIFKRLIKFISNFAKEASIVISELNTKMAFKWYSKDVVGLIEIDWRSFDKYDWHEDVKASIPVDRFAEILPIFEDEVIIEIEDKTIRLKEENLTYETSLLDYGFTVSVEEAEKIVDEVHDMTSDGAWIKVDYDILKNIVEKATQDQIYLNGEEGYLFNGVDIYSGLQVHVLKQTKVEHYVSVDFLKAFLNLKSDLSIQFSSGGIYYEVELEDGLVVKFIEKRPIIEDIIKEIRPRTFEVTFYLEKDVFKPYVKALKRVDISFIHFTYDGIHFIDGWEHEKRVIVRGYVSVEARVPSEFEFKTFSISSRAFKGAIREESEFGLIGNKLYINNIEVGEEVEIEVSLPSPWLRTYITGERIDSKTLRDFIRSGTDYFIVGKKGETVKLVSVITERSYPFFAEKIKVQQTIDLGVEAPKDFVRKYAVGKIVGDYAVITFTPDVGHITYTYFYDKKTLKTIWIDVYEIADPELELRDCYPIMDYFGFPIKFPSELEVLETIAQLRGRRKWVLLSEIHRALEEKGYSIYAIDKVLDSLYEKMLIETRYNKEKGETEIALTEEGEKAVVEKRIMKPPEKPPLPEDIQKKVSEAEGFIRQVKAYLDDLVSIYDEILKEFNRLQESFKDVEELAEKTPSRDVLKTIEGLQSDFRELAKRVWSIKTRLADLDKEGVGLSIGLSPFKEYEEVSKVLDELYEISKELRKWDSKLEDLAERIRTYEIRLSELKRGVERRIIEGKRFEEIAPKAITVFDKLMDTFIVQLMTRGFREDEAKKAAKEYEETIRDLAERVERGEIKQVKAMLQVIDLSKEVKKPVEAVVKRIEESYSWIKDRLSEIERELPRIPKEYIDVEIKELERIIESIDKSIEELRRLR